MSVSEINVLVHAIVLIYYPEKFKMDFIKTLVEQFDSVVVVDNGCDPNTSESILKYSGTVDGLQYICNGKNIGVPAGYNVGIRKAILGGATYVTILDQDSVLPTNYRNTMCQSYDELSLQGKRIGAISPMYSDVNTGQIAKVTLLKCAWFERVKGDVDSVSYPEISLPIASGTMYNVDIFEENGFFDETFFVDHFETEFNLRLLAKRFQIFLNPHCVMKHSLGNRTLASIIGVPFSPINHSPLRRYYAYRNKFYLAFRYGLSFPSLVLFEIFASFLDITRILFLEDQKYEKMTMILKGITGFIKKDIGELRLKNPNE